MSFTHRYLGRQGPQLPAEGVFLHENLGHETAMLFFSKENGVRGFKNFLPVFFFYALLKRIKFFKKYYFYFICIGILCPCKSMNCTGAGFSQVSDPLELGLQAVVSQTWVVWMSSQPQPLNPKNLPHQHFLFKKGSISKFLNSTYQGVGK